ncbi:hypothetical protein Tco_0824269, partial [Tanacetum coccineum]
GSWFSLFSGFSLFADLGVLRVAYLRSADLGVLSGSWFSLFAGLEVLGVAYLREIIMISSGSNTSSESNSSEDSVQQWYYNGTESSNGPSKALLQWYEDVMESSRVPLVERLKKFFLER